MPAPSAEQPAGTLRFAGAPRPGLLPPMKQKAQINPGLSLSLDEKRGHVNGQSSERGRHLLDQLELQLERDGTDRFDPGRSEPDRIRRELPLRRRRAEVRVILDMMREAKGPVTRGQR